MIIKGNVNSPLLVITSNLSKLDLFYKEPFQGLDGIWLNTILHGYNPRYIGFENENVENELLNNCKADKLLICGKKIQKILKNSAIYTNFKCLDIHHPSYLLQRSFGELDEEENKIKAFLNGK